MLNSNQFTVLCSLAMVKPDLVHSCFFSDLRNLYLIIDHQNFPVVLLWCRLAVTTQEGRYKSYPLSIFILSFKSTLSKASSDLSDISLFITTDFATPFGQECRESEERREEGGAELPVSCTRSSAKEECIFDYGSSTSKLSPPLSKCGWRGNGKCDGYTKDCSGSDMTEQLLMQAGDVESNPGPSVTIEDCKFYCGVSTLHEHLVKFLATYST